MSNAPLSAADIAALRDLLAVIPADLLPLAVDQARSDFWTGYFVADANGLEFASVRNEDEETASLIARTINALPALLDAAEALGTARQLLGWFADTDPCEFDHHGGCQAHGHYEPAPGEECPNATALRWLAEHPEESR